MANYDFSDELIRLSLDKQIEGIQEDYPELKLGLFINDYLPVPGTDLADLVEAFFSGYERQDFDPLAFGETVVTAHVASAVSADAVVWEQIAVPDPVQVIYGYFALNEDGDLVWCARFPAPFDIAPGTPLRIAPKLSWKTC